VVRDRAQYDDLEEDGDDTGGVAIERFYRYGWKEQLNGKSEVLGTRDEDGKVVGETFETTYNEFDQ
jgi:hypothetical protein